jgi:hypothetical protein
MLIETSEMTIQQRQNLLDVEEIQQGFDENNDSPMDLDDPFLHPPIGEEGAYHSNAGNDKEVMTEIEEEMAKHARQ